MEIMIQWFWLSKVMLGTIAIYHAYQLAIKKQYTKFNWFGLIAALVFFFIAPVKMDTGVQNTQQRTNAIIEQQKVLPDKIEDNSWEDTKKNTVGITKEDLK